MPRRRYTLGKLKYEAAQAKRQILTRVRRGKLGALVKQDTYLLLAKRVGLKTDRTLWDGEQGEYLNQWYENLHAEILKTLKLNENGQSTLMSESGLAARGEELESKCEKQAALLIEYRRALDVLRVENDELRTRLIAKFGRIGED